MPAGSVILALAGALAGSYSLLREYRRKKRVFLLVAGIALLLCAVAALFYLAAVFLLLDAL